MQQSLTSKLRLFLSLFAAVMPLQIALSQTAFPAVNDLKDVTIQLQRADPMGGGPTYKLTISGDGTVHYEGYASVHIRGRRTGRISHRAVTQLIEEFRKARFFELHNYQSSATDLPVTATTFQVGSIRKVIVDYGFTSSDLDTPEGSRSGAPEALVQLETRIDEIANSRRWVKGAAVHRLLHLH